MKFNNISVFKHSEAEYVLHGNFNENGVMRKMCIKDSSNLTLNLNVHKLPDEEFCEPISGIYCVGTSFGSSYDSSFCTDDRRSHIICTAGSSFFHLKSFYLPTKNGNEISLENVNKNIFASKIVYFCNYANYNYASTVCSSLLTENKNIYSWDPQHGFTLTVTESNVNPDLIGLEYTFHPKLLYAYSKDNILIHDQRVDGMRKLSLLNGLELLSIQRHFTEDHIIFVSGEGHISLFDDRYMKSAVDSHSLTNGYSQMKTEMISDKNYLLGLSSFSNSDTINAFHIHDMNEKVNNTSKFLRGGTLYGLNRSNIPFPGSIRINRVPDCYAKFDIANNKRVIRPRVNLMGYCVSRNTSADPTLLYLDYNGDIYSKNMLTATTFKKTTVLPKCKNEQIGVIRAEKRKFANIIDVRNLGFTYDFSVAKTSRIANSLMLFKTLKRRIQKHPDNSESNMPPFIACILDYICSGSYIKAKSSHVGCVFYKSLWDIYQFVMTSLLNREATLSIKALLQFMRDYVSSEYGLQEYNNSSKNLINDSKTMCTAYDWSCVGFGYVTPDSNYVGVKATNGGDISNEDIELLENIW